MLPYRVALERLIQGTLCVAGSLSLPVNPFGVWGIAPHMEGPGEPSPALAPGRRFVCVFPCPAGAGFTISNGGLLIHFEYFTALGIDLRPSLFLRKPLIILAICALA